MKLTQPEIIQILRRRKDMNQGTLGQRAFETSFESGRTKIKNIELGRQRPTPSDLKNLAVVLEVPIEALNPLYGMNHTPDTGQESRPGLICLKPETTALFPGLAPYFEMLNKAVTLDDEELIQHLSDKIAQLFRQRHQSAVAKPSLLASGKK